MSDWMKWQPAPKEIELEVRVRVKDPPDDPDCCVNPPLFEGRTVRFRLVSYQYEGRVFSIYECQEEGCLGAGCPEFEGSGGPPKEVWDRLREHAEMAHYNCETVKVSRNGKPAESAEPSTLKRSAS